MRPVVRDRATRRLPSAASTEDALAPTVPVDRDSSVTTWDAVPSTGDFLTVNVNINRNEKSSNAMYNELLSKLPEGILEGVNIELFSDNSILQGIESQRFVEITNPMTKPDKDMNMSNTIYDPRLGSSAYNEKCGTCRGNSQTCTTGHLIGVIPLNTTIIIPGYQQTIAYILQSICDNCKGASGLLLPDSYLEILDILPKIVTDDEGNELGEFGLYGYQRLRKIAEQSVNKECHREYQIECDDHLIRCGSTQPTYKVEKQSSEHRRANDISKIAKVISYLCKGTDGENIKGIVNEEHIAEALERLPDDVVTKLGFNFTNPPRNMMMSYLFVLPSRDRITRQQIKNNQFDHNPIDNEYSRIIKLSNRIKERKQEIERLKLSIESQLDESILVKPINDLNRDISEMKDSIAHLFDEEKKENRTRFGNTTFQGYKQQLSGKEGLIRGGNKTKRTNYSANTVVGPFTSPHLFAVEISKELVHKPGHEITVPVEVTHDNINVIRELLATNEILHIQRKGSSYRQWVKNKNIPILPGDTIYRKFQDGDWLYISRPPSLHKYNNIATQGFIATDSSLGIKAGLEFMQVLAGDYDGDVLTLHFPQSVGALKDLENVMSARSCLLNAATNKPTGGIVFHGTQGAYNMTLANSRIKAETFEKLCRDLVTIRSPEINDYQKRLHRLSKATYDTIDVLKMRVEMNEQVEEKTNRPRVDIPGLFNLYSNLLREVRTDRNSQNIDDYIRSLQTQFERLDSLSNSEIVDFDRLNEIKNNIADISTQIGISLSSTLSITQGTTGVALYIKYVLANYKRHGADAILEYVGEDTKIGDSLKLDEQLTQIKQDVKKRELRQAELADISLVAILNGQPEPEENIREFNILKSEVDDLRRKFIETEDRLKALRGPGRRPAWYSGRFLFSLLLPLDFYYEYGRDKKKVSIRDGVFLKSSSHLTKDHISGAVHSIHHEIGRRYGLERMYQFYNEANWILSKYTEEVTFSLSGNCVSPVSTLLDVYKEIDLNNMNDRLDKLSERTGLDEARRNMEITAIFTETLNSITSRVNNLLRVASEYEKKRETLLPIPDPSNPYDVMAIEDAHRRNHQLEHYEALLPMKDAQLLDAAKELLSMDDENRQNELMTYMQTFAVSGSRGSLSNERSAGVIIGPNYVNNDIPKKILRDKFGGYRSTVHFSSREHTGRSYGFSERSYVQGNTVPAFIFQAMSGRVGSIDTNLRLPVIGQLRRRLMGALQNLVVDEYSSVVDLNTNRIYQITYGDTGLWGEYLVVSNGLLTFFDAKTTAQEINASHGQYNIEQPEEQNQRNLTFEERINEDDIDMDLDLECG